MLWLKNRNYKKLLLLTWSKNILQNNRLVGFYSSYYLSLYASSDRATIIWLSISGVKHDSSGVITLFAPENALSFVLEEAGAALIRISILYSCGKEHLLEYQNETTEKGYDENSSLLRPIW